MGLPSGPHLPPYPCKVVADRLNLGDRIAVRKEAAPVPVPEHLGAVIYQQFSVSLHLIASLDDEGALSASRRIIGFRGLFHENANLMLAGPHGVR
jgi:hypothetical protein